MRRKLLNRWMGIDSWTVILPEVIIKYTGLSVQYSLTGLMDTLGVVFILFFQRCRVLLPNLISIVISLR
jgi:hypothetical protein